MQFDYRDREPMPLEIEKFGKDVSEDLGLDTDTVIVYDAEHNGGVYTGRIDGAPVIGLSDDRKHVLAHELGHDRYAQEVEESFMDGEPELDENGAIIVDSNSGDSIQGIVNEIFASNVASDYFNRDDLFTRYPISSVTNHLERFTKLSYTDFPNQFSLIEDSFHGEHFVNPDTAEHYDALAKEIRQMQNSEEDELQDLLINTWKDRVHTCYVQGRDDIIWDNIHSHTDVDYGDIVWHNIPSEYETEIRSNIDDNLEELTVDIVEDLLIENLKLQVETPAVSVMKNFPTVSAGHLSSLIQTDRQTNLRTDYNHDIGNYVGRTLHELGADFHDLEDKSEDLEKLAQKTLDIGIEMGKNNKFYDEDDFDEEIERVARDIGIIQQQKVVAD